MNLCMEGITSAHKTIQKRIDHLKSRDEMTCFGDFCKIDNGLRKARSQQHQKDYAFTPRC
jgi:hypothetical protein